MLPMNFSRHEVRVDEVRILRIVRSFVSIFVFERGGRSLSLRIKRSRSQPLKCTRSSRLETEESRHEHVYNTITLNQHPSLVKIYTLSCTTI